MTGSRRTLRQIHPNLSRQFPNQFEFLTAVNNFNAENLRRTPIKNSLKMFFVGTFSPAFPEKYSAGFS